MLGVWSLDRVSLATESWRVYRATARDRSWYEEHGDPVRLRLVDRPPLERSIEGWRARAVRETAMHLGALLAFDEVTIDGRLAFQGLFKYPATRMVPGVSPRSLAVYVVGLIVVPLGGCHLLVNTEALEHGTTGFREALYAMLNPPTYVEAQPGTMEDHYANVREAIGMVLPSDDAAFDANVPGHPLSRVRAMQRRVVATMRIRDALPS